MLSGLELAHSAVVRSAAVIVCGIARVKSSANVVLVFVNRVILEDQQGSRLRPVYVYILSLRVRRLRISDQFFAEITTISLSKEDCCEDLGSAERDKRIPSQL